MCGHCGCACILNRIRGLLQRLLESERGRNTRWGVIRLLSVRAPELSLSLVGIQDVGVNGYIIQRLKYVKEAAGCALSGEVTYLEQVSITLEHVMPLVGEIQSFLRIAEHTEHSQLHEVVSIKAYYQKLLRYSTTFRRLEKEQTKGLRDILKHLSIQVHRLTSGRVAQYPIFADVYYRIRHYIPLLCKRERA